MAARRRRKARAAQRAVGRRRADAMVFCIWRSVWTDLNWFEIFISYMFRVFIKATKMDRPIRSVEPGSRPVSGLIRFEIKSKRGR